MKLIVSARATDHMDTLDYNPYDELPRLLSTPRLLDELDDMLKHTHLYRTQLSRRVVDEIADYNAHLQATSLKENITDMTHSIEAIKDEARKSETQISEMTLLIQKLDSYKRNLVTLMTILKRLQMLINAHNQLMGVITTRKYDEIFQMLLVVREFLGFFRPYKLIDEINKINLMVQKTQTKLVSDILLDFEEAMTTSYSGSSDLRDGARIIELVDPKNKDKVLSQFYNLQLRDIKSIFSNNDEAGSLDNFNRRYLYFVLVLDKMELNFSQLFPEEWNVELELSKVFCQMSKQDLLRLLTMSLHLSTILSNLTATIDFEKQLNDRLNTVFFDKLLSSVFEDHLDIWISEQDNVLRGKMQELLATPLLPTELSSAQSHDELMEVLRTNNVPNISNPLIDLFKHFQKVSSQILKLSNGPVIISLARLFIKYLLEYNTRALVPLIPVGEESVNAIDCIKYLTMVMNTSDYIMGNLDDTWQRLAKVIQPQLISKLPSADPVRETFQSTVNKVVQCLVVKCNQDLRWVWRQYVNQNWNLEASLGLSSYVPDLIKVVTKQNAELILPLIIRDAYSRNYCDKIVELVVSGYTNHLVAIKPMTVLMVERILNDVAATKLALMQLPLYADPNFRGEGNPSKLYAKHLELHFGHLERILNLLSISSASMEDFIAAYFDIIGDNLVTNFLKVLTLKGIEDQKRYVEVFKLQLTAGGEELARPNPLLVTLEDDNDRQLSSRPGTPILRDEIFDSSPTPEVKSPRLLAAQFGATIQSQSNKITNLERNIRDMGETRVAKFNENFKKLFRKDE